MNTERAPRSAHDLYLDLNSPIRKQGRAPATAKAPVQTPRARQTIQRHFTDAKEFTSIKNKTISVENIVQRNLRSKEDDLQIWIEETNPDPFEVLQKIADISRIHKNLLEYIIEQLKKFPKDLLVDPIIEINHDCSQELIILNKKEKQIQEEIGQLHSLKQTLKMKLEEISKERNEIKTEYESYLKRIKQSSFKEYENEQSKTQSKASSQSKNTNEYNQVWGENSHLRSEIEKANQKLSDIRKKHLEYAYERAMIKVKEQSLPQEEIFIPIDDSDKNWH